MEDDELGEGNEEATYFVSVTSPMPLFTAVPSATDLLSIFARFEYENHSCPPLDPLLVFFAYASPSSLFPLPTTFPLLSVAPVLKRRQVVSGEAHTVSILIMNFKCCFDVEPPIAQARLHFWCSVPVVPAWSAKIRRVPALAW